MKNKKIIIILIFVTLLLLTKVNAGERDSTLIKNRIEGIYAIAPLSDRTHIYYLQKYTLNGITSYCIEIGKDIKYLLTWSILSMTHVKLLTSINSL